MRVWGGSCFFGFKKSIFFALFLKLPFFIDFKVFGKVWGGFGMGLGGFGEGFGRDLGRFGEGLGRSHWPKRGWPGGWRAALK